MPKRTAEHTLWAMAIGLTVAAAAFAQPGLSLGIEVDRTRIVPFEPLLVTTTVRNDGEEEVTLLLALGAPRPDLSPIFVRMEHGSFEALLSPQVDGLAPRATLAPGEERSDRFRLLFSRRVDAGENDPYLFDAVGRAQILRLHATAGAPPVTSNVVEVEILPTEHSAGPARGLLRQAADLFHAGPHDPEVWRRVADLMAEVEEKHAQTPYAPVAAEIREIFTAALAALDGSRTTQ